ncbi:sulfite reductase, dissimilatory-type subunit gamma [bacterium BMS3Abin02]|nr:sulfite reductase, dissimilatory-type subunit gamma [bacterium BMS3Abin02]GBE21444.1 sulfite reductase, dissimilatory-type subunit gamma [bacterium BMS3Bbin01]HDH26509.1 TusE/DsrC/DsvC family sulfur relay protein [Actinomycetota bacterium]HDK45368.1 TusE/DsrC/DsvC family sulfur relay protein [Actinomycetota bacterium]
MATEVIAGHEISVDDEGFMTDPSEWSEELAEALAKEIHIDELTEVHWKVIRFLRADHAEAGETATIRRVSMQTGLTTKQLYQLFPKKPAKKMAYISGLPKPTGCV